MKYLSLLIAILVVSACNPSAKTEDTKTSKKEVKKEVVKKETKTKKDISKKEVKEELKQEVYKQVPGKLVDTTVIAKFSGKEILLKDIKKLYPNEVKAAQDEYIKTNFGMISQKVSTYAIEKLLNQEAKKQGLNDHKELLDKVTAKAKNPSKKEMDEMKKKFAKQLAAKKMSAKEVDDSIRAYILNERKNNIALKFLENLKKENAFKISLPYPNIPVTKINISENDPYKGKKDAKYVLVEFSDFECPYCSQVAPIASGVVKNNKDVKVVFKHFPLSFHKMAKKASIASQCANYQGKFWELHDKIFENQKDLNEINLQKWVAQLKLDMSSFNKCLKSTDAKNVVENAFKEGTRIGVKGTPSLFLNGVQVNASTPQALEEAIRAEREKVIGELTNETVIASFGKVTLKWSDFLKENRNFDSLNKAEKIKKDFELYNQLLSRELSKQILDKAAKEKGFKDTNEYMKKIVDGIKSPSDKELKDLYEQLKPKLQGKTLDQIKPQLIQYSQRMNSQKVIQAEMKKLSQKYNVQITMPLPMMPAFNINTEGSPVMGNKDAKYTLVEFSDFECPYCSKGNDFVKQVLKKFPKKVKVVFKHFPLPFHKNAKAASVASICAHKQGKFETFHNRLFENQTKLSEKDFIALATELKLNLDNFKKCLKDPAVSAKVNQDLKDGQEIGVQGTPTMYLNGVIYKSAQTIEEFSKLIK